MHSTRPARASNKVSNWALVLLRGRQMRGTAPVSYVRWKMNVRPPGSLPGRPRGERGRQQRRTRSRSRRGRGDEIEPNRTDNDDKAAPTLSDEPPQGKAHHDPVGGRAGIDML